MTSISHDLRTPLANLRAMVEAIDDGVVDDPAIVREYSHQMLRLDPDAGGDGGGSVRPVAGGRSRVSRPTRASSASPRPSRHAVELCDHDARVKSITRAHRPGIGRRRPLLRQAGSGARLAGRQRRPLHPEGGCVTVTAARPTARSSSAWRTPARDSPGAATTGVRAVLAGRRLALDRRLRARTDARAADHPRTRRRDPCSQRAGRWLALSCRDPRPPSRRGMNPDP